MAGFLESLGLGGAAAKYHSLKGHIGDRGENITGEIVKGAEVLGSSFLTAYANGYYASANTDHAEITTGVPADITVGVGLLALGLMGFAGKFSDTLCNLGTGALAAYSARLGTNWGAQARLKKAGATVAKGNVLPHGMRVPNVIGAGGYHQPANVVSGAPPVYHPAADVSANPNNPWVVPMH
jgi:hypothetical protein